MIEVIDGRAEDLLRRVGAGGSTWAELNLTYERLITAMAASDSDGIRLAMNDLRQLAVGGAEADKLWAEFDRLMKRRAALVDAERRFALAAHDAMSREQVAAHASALVAAITRHVKDPATLNAIMADVRGLIEAPLTE